MQSEKVITIFALILLEFYIKHVLCWHVLSEKREVVGSSFLQGSPYGGSYGAAPGENEGESKSSNAEIALQRSLHKLSPVKYNFDVNSTIIDVPEEEHSFIQFFTKCVPIIKYCLLTGIPSPACPLACLLDACPHGRHLIYVLKPTVKSLCTYVQSVFDTGLGLYLSVSHTVSRLSQFLQLYGVGRNGFPGFAAAGASGLPMQLIKYASSPILDILKPVMISLERIVNSAAVGFRSRSLLTNSYCFQSDLTDAAESLAGKIIEHPYVTDVILEGWFVLSNLVYRNLGAESAVVHAVLRAFTLMTGVHCSLVQYAETGQATNCESVMGGKWEMREGHSYQEICGLEEDTDFVDFSKTFPDIFRKVRKNEAADTFYVDEEEQNNIKIMKAEADGEMDSRLYPL